MAVLTASDAGKARADLNEALQIAGQESARPLLADLAAIPELTEERGHHRHMHKRGDRAFLSGPCRL